ncbi:MAG TPA: SLC13 family permease [Candidatus Limnocylindrales bacterium]|nr:SLC13 family permease [Candidatus Limnocylindrales bacterium]
MQRTDLERRLWRARKTASLSAARAGARSRRIAIGCGVALALTVIALVGHALLGRLGDPFVLLVALPPLAHALAAFGLRDLLARRVATVRTGERRLIAAYGLWLGASALLSVDVAAVTAGSVSMAIGRDHGERRWQLGAAVVGSNVGGLLFPFSNLANVVLVAGSGIGLAAYLGAAVPALIAAAVAGGVLLLARFVQDQDADRDDSPAAEDPPLRYAPARGDRSAAGDQASILAAALAGAVAVVSIVSGLTGGSLVWPFLAGSAILVAWSIAGGRLDPRVLRRSAPVAASAVIVVAGVLAGPISGLAGFVPRPHDTSAMTSLGAAAVGAVLAALVSPVPAAAFGAAWLGVASPVLVVAFLIGTNVGSMATPRGSLVAMLARSSARASARLRLRESGVRAYLAGAWRYGTVAGVAGLVALVVIR